MTDPTVALERAEVHISEAMHWLLEAELLTSKVPAVVSTLDLMQFIVMHERAQAESQS